MAGYGLLCNMAGYVFTEHCFDTNIAYCFPSMTGNGSALRKEELCVILDLHCMNDDVLHSYLRSRKLK